jgi:hypothetical protein
MDDDGRCGGRWQQLFCTELIHVIKKPCNDGSITFFLTSLSEYLSGIWIGTTVQCTYNGARTILDAHTKLKAPHSTLHTPHSTRIFTPFFTEGV